MGETTVLVFLGLINSTSENFTFPTKIYLQSNQTNLDMTYFPETRKGPGRIYDVITYFWLVTSQNEGYQIVWK